MRKPLSLKPPQPRPSSITDGSPVSPPDEDPPPLAANPYPPPLQLPSYPPPQPPPNPLLPSPLPAPVSASAIKEANQPPDFHFYVENFPSWCSFQDLKATFNRVGQVTHLFIARRRNKRGVPFGFVCFKRDGRAQYLYERLDDIWIGSYKLRINPAKHDRRSNSPSVSAPFRNNLPRRFQNRRRDGRSFVEVVAGHKGSPSVRQQSSANLPSFSTDPGNLEWLERSFVGFAREVSALPDLVELLVHEEEWIQSVRVMGSNALLVTFHTQQLVADFLQVKAEALSQWFFNFKQWEPSIVASERLAWIRMEGIPLHAWCENFFCYISSLLGNLVKIDEDTVKHRRFDVARMLISTSSKDFIARIIKVAIDESVFDIKISEEPCGGLFNIEKEKRKEIRKADSCFCNSVVDVPSSSHRVDGYPSSKCTDPEGLAVESPRDPSRGLASPLCLEDQANFKGYEVGVGPKLDLVVDLTDHPVSLDFPLSKSANSSPVAEPLASPTLATQSMLKGKLKKKGRPKSSNLSPKFSSVATAASKLLRSAARRIPSDSK